MARTTKMTQEQREALTAARVQAAEQNRVRRSKCLTVGAWSIYRFDEYNVALQKGDDDPGFFPDTQSALKMLFRKMTDVTGKSDLGAHLKAIAAAESRILAAVANMPALFEVEA